MAQMARHPARAAVGRRFRFNALAINEAGNGEHHLVDSPLVVYAVRRANSFTLKPSTARVAK